VPVLIPSAEHNLRFLAPVFGGTKKLVIGIVLAGQGRTFFDQADDFLQRIMRMPEPAYEKYILE